MTPVLSAQGIHFAYPRASWGWQLDSFELAPGERLFLHGPSGAGKSTFLALLTGILTPSRGEISLGGEAFSTLSRSRRDRLRGQRMGIIFQTLNLIPYLSAVDNVKLAALVGGRGRDQEALELLLALGLESEALRKARDLSLGQQQRVAQARALMGSPALVIADEPTSSLDAHNTRLFMEQLLEQQIQQGFALVMVAHDQRLARYFDQSREMNTLWRRTHAA